MKTRLLPALPLLLASLPLSAATRTWPGAAPCNGTLQACIDASAASDTVLVASHAVTDTVLVNKPLILRAASGYRPVFAVDASIGGNVNAAGDWTWHIEGFTFEQGVVQLSVNGGSRARVIIRNLRMLRPTASGAAQISVYRAPGVTAALDYDISRNVLDYAWSTYDGALRTPLQVLDSGSTASQGRIAENRIAATGTEAHGILLSTNHHAHRVALYANQILGGALGSVYLRHGSSSAAPGGGSITTLLTSNVLRSATPGERRAGGIRFDVRDGAVATEVLHNTITDAARGIDFLVGSGVGAGGTVAGNVFADLNGFGLSRPPGSSISDSRNLFSGTLETAATAGLNPDSIFASPRFRATHGDPHLAADSPALDVRTPTALRATLAAWNVPEIDGDGLRRVKQANPAVAANTLDLGALEAGDVTGLHRIAPPLANVVMLENAALDGHPTAAPQVTSNWNPDGVGGVYSNHATSAVYSTGRWHLRNESLAAFADDAAFNLFAPGRGDGRFVHLTSAANINGHLTELDDAALNNREDAIVLVTRNPGSGPTIADLVSPLAVNYFSGVWSVLRTDGAPMPVSGAFNVYVQPASANAFVHTAAAANIFGNATDLDHPLLNGHPCARAHITQVTDFSVIDNHHTGLYYEASVARWSIYNQSLAPMPPGARFHVVVDPQAVNCPSALFADGFEAPAWRASPR